MTSITAEAQAFHLATGLLAPDDTTDERRELAWRSWRAGGEFISAKVFEALGLDHERYITEGGSINVPKLRATIKHPADYLPPDHWMSGGARMKTAYEQMVAAQVANRAFEDAIERQWPIGSAVSFRISSTQKNPSTGIVSGYLPFGGLRVKHDQATLYSRMAYRSVHINDLILERA